MSARSLNKVLLIGNLTRDPEVRFTGNGTAVASFSIATNKSWKDQNGEMQESTQYHNIVAWNKLAEICQQLLSKGMKVFIEGELNTRSWEDEKSKETKYRTEIRADNLILLDSKGKSGMGGAPAGSASPAAGGSDDDGMGSSDPFASSDDDNKKASDTLADDDLPF